METNDNSSDDDDANNFGYLNDKSFLPNHKIKSSRIRTTRIMTSKSWFFCCLKKLIFFLLGARGSKIFEFVSLILICNQKKYLILSFHWILMNKGIFQWKKIFNLKQKKMIRYSIFNSILLLSDYNDFYEYDCQICTETEIKKKLIYDFIWPIYCVSSILFHFFMQKKICILHTQTQWLHMKIFKFITPII